MRILYQSSPGDIRLACADDFFAGRSLPPRFWRLLLRQRLRQALVEEE